MLTKTGSTRKKQATIRSHTKIGIVEETEKAGRKMQKKRRQVVGMQIE